MAVHDAEDLLSDLAEEVNPQRKPRHEAARALIAELARVLSTVRLAAVPKKEAPDDALVIQCGDFVQVHVQTSGSGEITVWRDARRCRKVPLTFKRNNTDYFVGPETWTAADGRKHYERAIDAVARAIVEVARME